VPILRQNRPEIPLQGVAEGAQPETLWNSGRLEGPDVENGILEKIGKARRVESGILEKNGKTRR
jgi:hypothetical protein